jgi:hypothetical protein
MNAKKHIMLVTVAVCALVLPALASLKNPITRPVKGNGHITTVVNWATGEAKFTQWGQVTHLGSWTDTGEGILSADFSYFVSGHGTTVAANGDTVDWEFTGPTSNRYTGGTGRFQGVTGGMAFTITWASEPVYNDDFTMMTTEFTYDMVGEVTY